MKLANPYDKPTYLEPSPLLLTVQLRFLLTYTILLTNLNTILAASCSKGNQIMKLDCYIVDASAAVLLLYCCIVSSSCSRTGVGVLSSCDHPMPSAMSLYPPFTHL